MHMLIVDHDGGGPFAAAEAFGEFERDLAVRRGAAGLDVELRAQLVEELFAAAELTGQASAHPEPFLAERSVLLAEELVEGHGVVDLGRGEVQHVGDLADRLARHAAQLVVDEMQGRQRHRLLAGIARQVRLDLSPNVFAQECHVSLVPGDSQSLVPGLGVTDPVPPR